MSYPPEIEPTDLYPVPNLPPQPGAVSPEKVEALRQALTGLFTVVDTTLDFPHPGHVRFRGMFLCDTAVCFDELRARFEQHGFTPLLRHSQVPNRTAVIAMPVVFDPPRSNPWVNLVLFLLTVLSTLFIGATYEVQNAETFNDLLLQLWRGWPFSLSILLILGAHELGHYFAARYHKVPVTLPYFIPMPFTIIGTMGAFIRLKAPVKNRRALMDIGAAGPWAGMLFAVPILLYGLATSEVGVPGGGYLEGNSILYALAKIVVFGRFLPSGGQDVLLNSVAWAGWVGTLVTGLNLIPLGQLDGGHVTYVLLGKQAKQLFWPFIIGLALLSFFTGSTTWLFWIVLLFFLGRGYAEPLDDVTELDGKRRIWAVLTLILFILVFIPVPLTLT
ncbi:MAG: site-2 protease family protein [Candidatus Promineifilaceae bacterium]